MALLAAVLLYLALALPQLGLPGLHYDEAKEAGINALEILQRQDVQAFRSAGVQLGPLFLPLMVQDYIGALNVYLALPLLAGLGATAPALRLLGVLCGLATLLLVCALGRELTQRGRGGRPQPGWAGEIAALLLAASPTFVFWSRQGIFVTNVAVTLAVATVWLALRWQRTGRPAELYGLALLAGLGLWSKLLFVWVLGALAGVAAVAWLVGRARGRSSPVFPRIPWRSLALAGLLFVLGLAPLLLFNQQTSGTVQALFGNLGQSYYGVENAAFAANLAVRLGQVQTLLAGDHLWYLGDSFANSWAVTAAVGLTALAIGLAAASGRGSRARASLPLLLAGLLFVLLLLAQSSFTVSDLFITHFAIIQPFVLLLAALAADSLLLAAQSWPRRWAVGLAVLTLAVLALWLGADARNSGRYHQALARSGGLASHSDAIDRLAQWLDAAEVRQPLALDWGIEAQVRYLTENRVQPLEIFGYQRLEQPDDGFAGRVEQFLADPTRVYIVRMPGETVFQGRREALESLAAAQGQRLVVREAIYDRSGQVMFVLLGVEAR
jgi:4-amino-4-deoxy-L-arabinose transferase-like glycosyltransferase